MPLKLLSSMATRDVLREMVSRYRVDTARAVDCEAAGGVDVAKRVHGRRGGGRRRAREQRHRQTDRREKIDCRQPRGSRSSPASRSPFERIARGRKSGPKRRSGAPCWRRRRLSYSTGPSGVYLEKLFERWGILEAIRNRIVVPPPASRWDRWLQAERRSWDFNN